MITLAGLAIFYLELLAIRKLFFKTFGDWEQRDIAEFVTRAPIEDFFKLRWHVYMMMFGLQIATMGRLFQ